MEYDNFNWYVSEIYRLAEAEGKPLGNIQWIQLAYMQYGIYHQMEPSEVLANLQSGNYPKIAYWRGNQG
jgi:hypothetical protein